MKMLLRYSIGASAATEMLVASSYEDFCLQICENHGLETDTKLKVTHNRAVLKNTATLEMVVEQYSDPEFTVAVVGELETGNDPENSQTQQASQSGMRTDGVLCKKVKLEAGIETDSKTQFIEHAKQTVIDVMSHSLEGKKILQKANQQTYLPNLDYKKSMEIFVVAIRAAPRSGKSSNELKFEYAVGFVNLFPIYKDPQTPWGCEAVYRKSTTPGGEPSGSLHNKFKNTGRAEKKMCKKYPAPEPVIKQEVVPKRLKMASPCLKRSLSFNDENLEKEAVDDNGEDIDSQMEVQGHIHWLKVNACEEKRAEVLLRLAKTFNDRSNSLHDESLDVQVTAFDILERYPCFMNIRGLVDHDFKLMLPQFENVLVEKWPSLKMKVKNWADKVLEAEPAKTATTDQLIECLASNPTKVPYLDDVMTIKILLAKLPSSNQAQKRGVKVSSKACFSYLLDFQSNGTDLKQLLADRAEQYQEPVAPYLLMVRSGKIVDSAFVIVDHKAIPTSTNVVKAFDTLFKSHYVFSLHYQPQLNNFMCFFQTAIYGIDIENTGENTTVRCARIAFG